MTKSNFERLLQAVESQTEVFLTQPQQFDSLPMPIVVWHNLRGDVYEHYLEQIETIKIWLNQSQ